MEKTSELRVQELLDSAITAGRFPGAVAMWGRAAGSPSWCVAGRSDIRSKGLEVSVDTWFDLASLTKPLVTTTLSLSAFREGALSPETRVGEVLRETRSSPVGVLEVHHLLTHTSGLPAWLPFYGLAEGRKERVTRVLQRIEVDSPPGSRVVYSCVGFIVLGLMLEQLSRTGLQTLFLNQVLEPMGLGNELGFNPDPDLRPLAGGALRPLAEELLVRERGLDPRWIPAVGAGLPDDGNARFFGGAAGNAGLFGTARGVYRLAAEYCGGSGALLASSEVRPAVTSQTARGLEEERGWGWQIATTRGCSAGAAVPVTAFGHTGFTGASVWAVPENGAIWVLLTNRNHPSQRGVDLHPIRRRFHALATQSARD